MNTYTEASSRTSQKTPLYAFSAVNRCDSLGGATLSSQPVRICQTLVLAVSFFLLLASTSASAMIPMTDLALSKVTGQALLQMNKTLGDGSNLNGSSGITFYKAGLDAKLALNMNIGKLQLGCTAATVNGQNCDIDIDHLSLSGNTWTNGRPDSDAILTHPFFEFAIKNDNSRTLRQISGIRLSAENVDGMLTFGDQNSSTPNGINALSGYMNLMQATGFGDLLPINMSYSCNQSRNATPNCGNSIDPVTMKLNGTGVDCTTVNCTLASNTAMVGTLCIYVFFAAECGSGRYAGNEGNTQYSSTDYTLPLAANGTTTYPVTGGSCPPNKVCFTTNATQVSGKRMTSVDLTGNANVPTVSFNCSSQCAYANTSYLGISLNAKIQGSMSNLKATVPISEALGMIHKLSVSSAFSLSFQNQDVLWPGENAVAQKGWWMAFNDPIDLGSISTSNPLVLTPQVLQQALCAPGFVAAGGGCLNDPDTNSPDHNKSYNGHYVGGPGGVNDALWYQKGGAIVNNAIVTLISPSINVGNIPLTAVVNYPFTNPQLSAQSFTTNCWGNSKFC
ncbi:MAG: hypothetical protein R3292_05785 [Alcanivorax sp.]|nr:hypothetical protein [Alcanivorax sp.]